MEIPKAKAAKSTVMKYAMYVCNNNRKRAESFVRGWYSVDAK